MDQSAVDRIAALGVDAARARQLETDTPAIVLRGEDGAERIQSLEAFAPGRSRFRGTFGTASLDDFADYVTLQRDKHDSQADGFIEPAHMSATVFFNMGDFSHPGHCDHRAELTLKPTAAYHALSLTARDGRQLTQRELHDFIEDWRDHITVLYAGQPAPADKPLSAALAAIRSITVDTARSEASEVRDMGASRSAMERVDASSKHQLPSGFVFRCVPYEGLPARDFTLRLGVQTGGDKIALVLRIQQREAGEEAIARDFRDILRAKVGVASTLTLGIFMP